MKRIMMCGFGLGLLLAHMTALAQGTSSEAEGVIGCANLVYAGSKSSVCFSPKFLQSAEQGTSVAVEADFTPVQLASDTLYEYPFAIMTGEGSFTLLESERKNLKQYLERGGFLLASAGCSSSKWGRSFQRELRSLYPDRNLRQLSLDHAIYHTVYDIDSVQLKNGGTTLLEGLEIDGRIVLVYTSEGLNDTSSVKGCCCCGGNEIKNSHAVNVNLIVYSLLH